MDPGVLFHTQAMIIFTRFANRFFSIILFDEIAAFSCQEQRCLKGRGTLFSESASYRMKSNLGKRLRIGGNDDEKEIGDGPF